jgi:replication factor C large subunit
VDPEVLEALSQRYHGDIRAAVRDLQSLCVDKTHVSFQDFQALGIRDHQKIIFDVLRDIFRTTNIKTIRSAMLHADEDPKLLLHWIAENVPNSYTNVQDLCLAYEALSNADRHLGRTSKRNYYGFWSYAYDEMGIGVALAKTSQGPQIKYTFPIWLKNLKKRKTSSADEKTLIEKLSKNYHCSTAKTYAFQIAMLERIISNQPDVALMLAKKLSLSDEELQYFGVKSSERKKEISSNEKTDDTDNETEVSQTQIHDKKEQTEEQKRQSLLIDF